MLTNINNTLPHATPEQQGIASAAVIQWVELLERQINEVHSFMLLRHGSVIAEGWWSPYEPQFPHMAFSLSKSFTSTAVGLAISEGYFNIDDTVVSFFPDAVSDDVSDNLGKMRVRHLLSMSTGHSDDTWMPMLLCDDGDWVKAFLEVPLEYEPGTHFLYNTGASSMLAAIVQKTTGMKLTEYLQPRLFEPLGMSNITWDESPQGIALGGVGLNIRTEDIARFGQLYLQNGQWQGQQIVSQAWIAEATTAQVARPSDLESDWSQGYGYQFWCCRHNAYRGDGVYGQFCIVLPEQDAVLAMTGATEDVQEILDFVWDILLPAMGDTPLPEDKATHALLSQKLSSLSSKSIQGQATSPLASQISNRTYSVDSNDLEIEKLSFTFTDSGCTLKLKTKNGEETIPCGYENWEAGQTTIFNDTWLTGHTAIMSSGAWTSEDTYTMITRFHETPFYYTLVFCFADEELIIEARINLSFETIRPTLLTAKVT